MIKKALLAASAAGLALAGVAMIAGPASAAKPVLDGTMDCNTAGTTTFNPPLVLSIPDKKPATATKPAKPGKDKKVKITTTTNLTGCTGVPVSGGLPIPSGGTISTKSSSPSRLCANQGSVAGGKTKVTLNDGSKYKEDSAGSSTTFLDSGTANNHADDIPLPTSVATLADIALNPLNPHHNDQLYLLGSGSHSLGKAFSGRTISSVSHSPGITAKFVACQNINVGLGTISTTGTQHIG